MAKKSSTKPTLAELKAENAQLKAENKRLSALISKKSASDRPSLLRFLRRFSVGALLFFAVCLITLGNLVFWTGNTLVKQDRFVDATAPIIRDTEVQKSLALYTTNQLFKSVDVEQITQDALPPKAQFLAPQLASQVKDQTNNLINKILANPKFQTKWDDTSAKWHNKIITYAESYEGNGEISINDVYGQVSGELSNTKLSFLAGKQLPEKVGSITVINATWLPTLHRVVTKIDTWRILSVLLLVVTLTGAVLLSKARRRTLYLFSFAAAGMMLATLIAVNLAKESAIGRVDPQYADGVRNAIQILTSSLVTQTITILLAAFLIGFITWISGNSRSAVAVKDQGVYLLTGRVHQSVFGESTSSVVLWTQKYKRQLQWSVVGVLAAIMLVVHLTLKALVIYAIVMLLSVLIIETIGSTQAPRPKK